MKKLVLCSFCFLSIAATEVQADTPYKFISLGLTNNNYLSDSEFIDYSSALTPKIAMGIGYSYDINSDYSLESEVSIDYSQINFSGNTDNIADLELTNQRVDAASFKQDGKVTAIGLWATARLNRKSLFTTSFASISPFIEMSVGSINLDHHFNSFANNEPNQVTAYQVSAGLTFDLDNGNSFSFALATGDSDKFNAF